MQVAPADHLAGLGGYTRMVSGRADRQDSASALGLRHPYPDFDVLAVDVRAFDRGQEPSGNDLTFYNGGSPCSAHFRRVHLEGMVRRDRSVQVSYRLHVVPSEHARQRIVRPPDEVPI